MKDRRLRVVHLIPHDGIGGVEVAARRLVCQELPFDFTLQLIAGEPLEGETPGIVAGRVGSPLQPRTQAHAFAALTALRPDVLIASLWKAVPVALAYRRRHSKVKLVAFLHSAERIHLPDRWLTRALVTHADAIWSDCAATAAAYHGSQPISLLLDHLSAPTAHNPAPRFVSWSRLDHAKGIDRSLRLIAALQAAGIDAHYDIWGPDAGAEATLRALARRLGLNAAVAFRGPVSRRELPQIAEAATFFLHLSRIEGMGMACVEAMQLGLVPVVTSVGEMATYVRDGINGFVIDVDRPPEAAARLAAVLDDHEQLANMREFAIAQWHGTPLYRDSIVAAVERLVADANIGQGYCA